MYVCVAGVCLTCWWNKNVLVCPQTDIWLCPIGHRGLQTLSLPLHTGPQCSTPPWLMTQWDTLIPSNRPPIWAHPWYFLYVKHLNTSVLLPGKFKNQICGFLCTSSLFIGSSNFDKFKLQWTVAKRLVGFFSFILCCRIFKASCSWNLISKANSFQASIDAKVNEGGPSLNHWAPVAFQCATDCPDAPLIDQRVGGLSAVSLVPPRPAH